MTTDELLYFVGSVPLEDCEDVFRQLGSSVGTYLKRIPDGETGDRLTWIAFQRKMLSQHPAMEQDPTQPPFAVRQSDGTILREIRIMRLKADVDPDSVEFDTGYDRAAIEAYQIFARLKAEGTIPDRMRFQFALPTPLATGLMFVSQAGRAQYVRAYERALLAALGRILAFIPHRELSIQFDVCQEVLLFENYFSHRDVHYKDAVFQQFSRLGAGVPADVELGFHLCYGSPGDQPLITMRDASVLVELMTGIVGHVRRPVDFIHIPVPRSAGDEFFAPMRNWQTPRGTQIYLGLLQHNDPAGDLARIAAARKVIPEFGVGAECGFGRTDPRRVPEILSAHRRAAEELAKTNAGSISARGL